MPDEQQPNPPGAGDTGAPSPGGGGGHPGTEPSIGAGGKGPGGKESGTAGIIALALYLVLFTLFVIYCLVKIWPVIPPSGNEPAKASASPSPCCVNTTVEPSATATPSPATQTASPAAPRTSPASSQVSPTPSPSPSPSASPTQPSPVTILWWQFGLWDEQRLLLLVLLGGALGTLVHSLRSVYWYIGNRGLVKSWMAMYFMMPFAGAALALVFYLVVRGGFFSPQSSFQQTSPFGFAAFAALIGMFSSQAVLKLKEVAEVLLSKPQGGANAEPQGLENPAVVQTPPTPSTSSTDEKPPVQQ